MSLNRVSRGPRAWTKGEQWWGADICLSPHPVPWGWNTADTELPRGTTRPSQMSTRTSLPARPRSRAAGQPHMDPRAQSLAVWTEPWLLSFCGCHALAGPVT